MGGGNNVAGSVLWLRLTEQRGRMGGGGRGRRRGATIAMATMEVGIRRGGEGVIIIIIYGSSRLSWMDGNKQ